MMNRNASSSLHSHAPRRRSWFALLLCTLVGGSGATVALVASAQNQTTAPVTAKVTTPTLASLLAQLPDYMKLSYLSALSAPLPAAASPSTALSSVPLVDANFINADGALGVHYQGGPTNPSSNAFFQSLGTNGRSCATCHQASDAMSVSVASIRRRFQATGGTDPLFAPVDGANCPSKVAQIQPGNTKAMEAAYSLLLNKGLFRIFLPVPKGTSDLSAYGGSPAHATEFTLSVVSDPYGCNTDPAHARVVDPVTQEVTQMVSVYRRPRMSANLMFMTTPALTLGPNAAFPNIDFVTGAPVFNPASGQPIGGNLMWDGREPTLESQARSATLGHAQALTPPTPEQIAQMVAFEKSVFAAQTMSYLAGDLTGGDGSTVLGGPKYMGLQPSVVGPFALFGAWLAPHDPSASWKLQQRASIARGQALFNERLINVGNVAGFNNAAVLNPPNPFPSTCASCHGNLQAGGEPFPASQRAIGTGGHAVLAGGPPPQPDLPIFKLSCRAPYATPFDGPEVLTNDPGLALITGRCADIGRKSVPQIRGLAARAPYFSDGSAATVRDLVRFYDRRFSIKLTEQESRDLTAFLLAL